LRKAGMDENERTTRLGHNKIGDARNLSF